MLRDDDLGAARIALGGDRVGVERSFDCPPKAGAQDRLVGLPRQCGSILAHWSSLSTKRSIAKLLHGSLNQTSHK